MSSLHRAITTWLEYERGGRDDRQSSGHPLNSNDDVEFDLLTDISDAALDLYESHESGSLVDLVRRLDTHLSCREFRTLERVFGALGDEAVGGELRTCHAAASHDVVCALAGRSPS